MSRKKEYIDLTCEECGISFRKEKREYTRQIKRKGGTARFFCGLSCTATYRNKNLSEEQNRKRTDHLRNIQKYTVGKNRKGKFSYYLRKARARSKGKPWGEITITEKYLEDLWKEQKGKCAFTGLSIEIKNERHDVENRPRTASLDRIDPLKGYEQGNVQFVCTSLNYAKHNYSDAEFKQFLCEVASAITPPSSNVKY